MDMERPLTRDLVLIGGGHTHALLLRMWGMDPLPGARVTLINPGPTSPYTGMLPGYIAGHYMRDQLDIDLVRLARFAGARIVFDKAAGIDRKEKLVHLEGRAPLRYDIASLDIGVTADLPSLTGFAEHAHSVKPLGPFAGAWEDFLERPAARAACVVIGGGVAGVEIALAMAHRLRAAGRAGASVTLIEAGAEILPGASQQTRKVLGGALARYGVRIVTGAEVSRITAGAAELADGQSLPSDFVVSTAGARAYPWLAATGLALTHGFVDVGKELRTSTDPDIFAVGDCAHLSYAPRPKAGVFAVREAPVLLRNLKAALSGGRLKAYTPQTDYLKLISAGDKSAVAEKHSVTLSGRWLWSLKDRIDSDFMTRLQDLPAMAPPSAPALHALDDEAEGREEMLCGGCGSKVGRDVLAEALAARRPATRADTLAGVGDDAAVLQTGGRLQVISTDHLRAFTQDPYLLAQIAAVHALGDVWAMGAEPQAALLSITLPRMSERMQAATLSEIVAAVSLVLAEAGADLVGGHTSLGQELSVGLTVTGLLDRAAIGLAGARPGDALVLTKPIGTGVILAAEMRGLARGSDVANAISSMKRPLGAASRLLAPAAHAMTDVTGFGLAGHLMSLLEASGAAARLTLADMPVLPGAESLSAQQVRSSIWRANARLDARVSRPASALSDLIHDPQTAGGLLAAVPGAQVPRLLAEFQAAGELVFVIGRIEAGAPHISVD
jgi:selenide,water dikinase